MKKTTAKEFKELMIDVYGEFDYNSIINKLSLLEAIQSDDYNARNFDALAERTRKCSDKMYDYLNNKGYYNNCF